MQESELHRINDARKGEIEYVSSNNTLEISKAKQMADIETSKFQNMISALGSDNIAKIATSGHDNQVCHTNMYPIYTWCPGTSDFILFGTDF